ncbi:MAG: FmdB family zinc ribbon protein [Anaerolineae bacterium]
MPIYDYCCASCGARFDKLVPIVSSSEELCPVCPKCGSAETHRIPSGFAMKGSQPEGYSATESEPTPAPQSPVTAKEDIDRWRKLSKKKD